MIGISFALNSLRYSIKGFIFGRKQCAEYNTSSWMPEPSLLESVSIQTTLYELMEAVNEEIHPGEEHWMSFIVDHMFFTGRVIKPDKK